MLARFYISRREYGKAAQVGAGDAPIMHRCYCGMGVVASAGASARAGRQHATALPPQAGSHAQPRSLLATHPSTPHPRQVYELLADRASGPGEQAVSLQRREEAYQAAVLQVGGPARRSADWRIISRRLPCGVDAPSPCVPALAVQPSISSLPACASRQAKSCGDAELLDRLEGKAAVVRLQAALADALDAAGAAGAGAGWARGGHMVDRVTARSEGEAAAA